jgi:undecaprenyl-diphosphatase
MSEFLKAVLLGIIQGLTEFLPVSSSGHLELAKYFLGTEFNADDSLLMSVVLHAATALSTIIVFRKDIWQILQGIFSKSWNEEKRFTIQIVISMIPATLAGLFLEAQISTLFDGRVAFVAVMLLVTGILLFLTDIVVRKIAGLNYSKAFMVGIAQAVALLPGISRSGATISTAVLLGIDKSKAARFSFLMVLPLIIGKMAKDLMDGSVASSEISIGVLAGGFIAALLAGMVACIWMIRLVRKSKLRYFAYYCFLVGLGVIVLYYFL